MIPTCPENKVNRDSFGNCENQRSVRFANLHLKKKMNEVKFEVIEMDETSRRRYIANALSGLQPLTLQERHKQIVEDIRKVADEQPEVVENLIRYWLEQDCT